MSRLEGYLLEPDSMQKVGKAWIGSEFVQSRFNLYRQLRSDERIPFQERRMLHLSPLASRNQQPRWEPIPRGRDRLQPRCPWHLC